MGSPYEMTTKNGYPFGEAASALQKCIRRGMEKEAMYWALEFELGNFSDYLWRRLFVIVCEDIGGANPELVTKIAVMGDRVLDLRKKSKQKSYDLCILGHAILEMARSPKSREADDFTNEVLRERRIDSENGVRMEVPDFALDKHTQRGRKLGRDILHFWQEGAKLENESYPSKYVGWHPEQGDGYHTADGKKAVEKPWEKPPKLQMDLPEE